MSSKTQTPAKLAFLDEPRAGRMNIQYAPENGDEVVENPPRFKWLPVVEDESHYVVRISSDEDFAPAKTQTFENIPLNFLTPDVTFKPGTYYWGYAVWDAAAGGQVTVWSKTRTFVVTEEQTKVPLVSRAKRYDNISTAHPRLWLNPERLETFKAEVAKDADYCTWSNFYEKSVTPWIDREIMPEPSRYENDQRTPPVWRQTYIDCQELIYAIRHLAVSGKVTDNQAHLDRAKEWLMSACEWDVDGATSRAYTDEWAFRVNVAFAWGYDWLYDQLTEEERTTVRKVLLERTRQTADHLIKHANIHLFPFDSHAVRAVSAVLIPACMAMWDEEPEAKEWLDYSVEFLSTVYTPWGDNQGGWAEGPHYWMTGMAYLTEAANLMKSYMGIDIYQRPFFQETGAFPVYTKSPNTRRATFGDDSTMGDLVCAKLGYNVRQYAGVTGNPAYQWYFEEILRLNPGTDMMFYNYGWWDFNFDDLMYHTDWPIVQEVPPADLPKVKWFKGVGWAAIQHRMDDPDQHIQFVMKASKYGSISHSHGDQNAFCLAGFGEDLAIQSGYYVAFNSSMHREWRRQTRSKNAILINGKGQYADKDKVLALRSSGELQTVEEREDHVYIKGDATPAYQHFNPSVTSVTREVYFVRNSYFVFIDSIDADEEVDIDWLLHANGEYELGKSSFRYNGEKAGFYGQVLWSEAGAPTLEQETGFPGVDPSEIEGLPESTCLKIKFPKSKRQRIATLLVPYSMKEPKRVFHFLDDQGYDADLYFTDADENSFKIVVQKLAKA